ncbi:immune inhibitor A [Demequina capsici]|uniref:Immune inhibitor A n=1 Tax=Demequina capsici TaxID=3075620 RepID=A0AA96FI45_9MICO|nr:immune inhibitor A domain-containing protein [Demequina sp. PMTSA13]WNM28781.1 immune inhibitor A [Demequina sp. PMTSA13]
MQRRTRGWLAATTAAMTISAGTALAPTAVGAPAADTADDTASVESRPDNRPGPLTQRQNERRKAAQDLILSGQAEAGTDGGVELGEGKHYQDTVTGTGQVFTILAEFGDQGSGKLGTTPGPLHNEIEEPDRSVNNSTHWVDDFNRAYYEDLFFGPGDSFADFYTQQSSGSYTVAGEVSDWVKVPGNASTYGDNSVEDYGGAWQFIADAANAWYDAQVAKGTSLEDIKAELASYDVWDRYDVDGDGNFNEPDGYLDHFQAVHAGEGEDAGGGAQGDDAIWSHRWYVNATDYGVTGPTITLTDPDTGLDYAGQVKLGGTQIGDTGIWIGDYTVEAENGGLGVFAHEFAHDLGLPDLYDTAGGENSTAFWTLMSSGSWLGDGGDDIGTKPNYFGPWEKLQLGWLDWAYVGPGTSGTYTLSPAALQTAGQEQALIVDVPDEGITNEYTTPRSGSYAWWTGSADDLNVTLTRDLDLTGLRSATVTAKAWYDIEAGYDYLYAEYSTDGGANWTEVGKPVDGSSNGRWSTLRYTVPGGGAVQFRFRYQTDGGVHYAGAFLDDIVIKSGGTTLATDDVESDVSDWTPDGFSRSTGTETSEGDRYYLVENRTYVGYDTTLRTGPYQFDAAYTAPDQVEHFAFQDGMLVWVVDEAYSDNNTIEHPGHGLALPVDSHPAKFTYPDGTAPSNRRQPFDAAFGLNTLTAVSLHKEIIVGKGKSQSIQSVAAVGSDGTTTQIGTFDDQQVDAFFDESNPLGGVLVAGAGVTVGVTSQTTGGTMTVDVVNPDPAA